MIELTRMNTIHILGTGIIVYLIYKNMQLKKAVVV